MSTKFLSPEWAEQLTERLNAHEGFQNEVRKRQCTIAWKVSDTPYGDEFEYHMAIDNGPTKVVIGPPPATPDLQLSCSYETLVEIVSGKLAGREAFQSKKLKSDARLIRILKFIGIFHELNQVTENLDVEY